jgi:hypothetical protein
MKFAFCFLSLLFIGFASWAQPKFPLVDKSPLDMSYYPDNYPLLKIQGKAADPLIARIIYSRPQKNSRIIFGDLIEYNKVWRLGANEATEIEFYQNVRVGNTKIKKGRYTLYCIPYADKWTFIINKETDTWGSFMYDAKKDIVRQDAPVQRTAEVAESFSFLFEKTPVGFSLSAAWDSVKVSLPIHLQ